jgi:hypothetical protein
VLEGSLSGATDVPGFDREALLGALRTDRAGERYVPRVPRRHMACRGRPLRCRFHGAKRHLVLVVFQTGSGTQTNMNEKELRMKTVMP